MHISISCHSTCTQIHDIDIDTKSERGRHNIDSCDKRNWKQFNILKRVFIWRFVLFFYLCSLNRNELTSIYSFEFLPRVHAPRTYCTRALHCVDEAKWIERAQKRNCTLNGAMWQRRACELSSVALNHHFTDLNKSNHFRINAYDEFDTSY